MWRGIERSLAIGLAIELTMVIGFGAFQLVPRWRLLRFVPTAVPPYAQAGEWSPDGGQLLAVAPDRFAVLRADASVVFPESPGRTPVWIDDRTLLTLVFAGPSSGPSTYQLFRVGATDGSREAIGEPLPFGFLTADGRGHVALRSGDGPLITRILDPGDGHVVAELPDFHPMAWTNDGALIVGRPTPWVADNGVPAQELYHWRPGEAPRRLGPNLIDVGDVTPISPSGDGVACVCAELASPSGVGPQQIYRLPLDGSSPTVIGPWRAPGGMAWFDDGSLALLDQDGLSRASISGARVPVDGVRAADLGFAVVSGYPYRFAGGVLLLLKDGTDLRGAIRLMVVDGTGGVRLSRQLTTEFPNIVIDPANGRAALNTTPGVDRDVAFAILEFR